MKYLLSNGRITQDLITYIKDIIMINMKLLKGDIPGFKGGSAELITDLSSDNLSEHIRSIVADILSRVKSSFPNLNLSIEGIDINNSIVQVKIKINDGIYIYDIKRRN